MASLRKSERFTSSRGHGCFTISPPQLAAAATRFPSQGSGRPWLELRFATKLSSAGIEPTAVLTFDLRVRRLNHSVTRSLYSATRSLHFISFQLFIQILRYVSWEFASKKEIAICQNEITLFCIVLIISLWEGINQHCKLLTLF